MNILWSVNTLMPNVAKKIGVKSSHAISWIDAMSKEIIKDDTINLAIASVANVKEFRKMDVDGIVYYIIPSKSIDNSWINILKDFEPDIIHLYGTEKTHNIPLIKHREVNSRIVVSLQGILKGYARVYYGGIDVSVLIKNMTLKDLLRGSVFSGRKSFEKGIEKEEWQLKHVKYVEGRSTWDRVYAMSINPDLKYFYCPRLIREPFYRIQWSPEKMESHSIFVHQGNYPIKGLHFLFEALPHLIKKFPDLKLYIAGNDILHRDSFFKKLIRNGYSKYLLSLYKKYNLEGYVVFLGRISAEEVAKRLSVTNVMVIPSVIENCPNSLAEAMLVGTPSVASYVGGNAELLNNGQCGELYCYNEPLMLAESIDKIFSSETLAKNYSMKSRELALERHNPAKLKKTLLGIYDQIIKNNEIS